MKKFLMAAGLSMIATAALAQSPSPDNSNYNATTQPNGTTSSTTAGQGTGAGADMSKMPVQGTDAMSTGSMTPDNGMMPKKTGAGLTSGGNSNATTDVNGVSSSTSAGQGTGAGADVAK